MKRFLALMMALAMLMTFASCGQKDEENVNNDGQDATNNVDTNDVPTTDTDNNDQPEDNGSKTLVVYFSGSGHTESVAGYISSELGADTFELTPVNECTSADLNWSNSTSRVNAEHEDESKRDVALVSVTPENWEDYNVVFVGYPIWWGIAAWPVNNFVKGNDFSGKTVIPFCTSTSSALGQSGELLRDMAGTGDWQTGCRFSSGASQSAVAQWVKSLGLSAASAE